MQAIFTILGNKLFLYAAIVIGILGFLQYNNYNNKKHNDALETYKRQVSGQLSEKERKMQEMKTELGVSRSKLITQQDLTKLLKKENEEIDNQFEEFKRKHDLVIKSRDKTIASLKQKINGGTTNVIVSGGQDECSGIEDRCIISYDWEDHLKRFKLKDPNIFNSNDEIFESEQIFKIYGEIYKQKNGSLQTRRLVLREVYKDKDGKYVPVPDAKAEIVDSDFQYSDSPTIEEWQWKDLFRLRLLSVGSITMFPDNGLLRIGLGLEFFSWNGVGVNTHVALDFNDINNLEARIGASYNPTIFGRELNLAIGMSAGTPFINIFKDYSLNLDLIFYINN